MPQTRASTKTIQKPSYGYGYGLFFVILILSLTGIFWWQLPPQVPLFYSLPYGTNQLATREWVLLLPGLAVLTWISYFLLSRLDVSSGIYIKILRWLHVLGLFLLTIALVHIMSIIL